MYFCSKCNYSFDVSKSQETEEKTIIKKVSDSLKLFEEGKIFSKYKADFKQEELEKNSKFKKFSEEDKNKFNILFNQAEATSIAQFKCNNCGFSKNIIETTLLYQYDVNTSNDKIRTLEENKLLAYNPILPRTHDYICKNTNCSTIISDAKKEAVFFRNRDSYKLNYVCCVCNFSW